MCRPWRKISCSSSAVYRRYSSCPGTEPCGTLNKSNCLLDSLPLNVTCSVLLVKNDRIHPSTTSDMPRPIWNVAAVGWSTQSNAADRSRRPSKVTCMASVGGCQYYVRPDTYSCHGRFCWMPLPVYRLTDNAAIGSWRRGVHSTDLTWPQLVHTVARLVTLDTNVRFDTGR